MNCICGNNPTPDIGTACGAGGTSGETPVTGDTPVTDPAAISSGTALDFKDYDDQLRSIVALAAEAEGSPRKMAENVASMKGGFQNLGTQAEGVKNALITLEGKAVEAVGKYAGKISEAGATFTATEDLYAKHVTYSDKLYAAAKAGTVQMLKTDEKIESYLPPADNAKIVAAVDQWKLDWEKQVSIPYNSAKDLLAMHGTRKTAFQEQITPIGAGIKKIGEEHTGLVTEAVKLVDDTVLDPSSKLSQITGRPKVVESTAPVKDAAAVAPLKKAAVSLRALDWEKLWAKGNAFNSEAAAKAEVEAWAKFNAAISEGKPHSLPAPEDLVTNNTRSK